MWGPSKWFGKLIQTCASKAAPPVSLPPLRRRIHHPQTHPNSQIKKLLNPKRKRNLNTPSELLTHASPHSSSLSLPFSQRGRKNGSLQSRGRLWLPLQGRPHRRLWRRQVESPLEVHQKRVQPRVQVHYWGRVRYKELECWWESDQGSDLGHCRTRKVTFLNFEEYPCFWFCVFFVWV